MANTKTSTNVMAITEQHLGLRLCKQCNKLLPLDRFRPDKRKYTCIEHLRAYKRKMVLGTHNKRAFNSLRCRARQDMLMFGHKRMAISRKLVTTILTDAQMADFSHYCLIPKNPDEILTADNVIVVNTFQRSYVVGRWRVARDTHQYTRDLAFILEAPERNDSK